jgi:hypothetical protein
LSYANIPDQYLECLMTRRHPIVWSRQLQQRVRLRYGPRRSDVLDLVEYTGKCPLCGTERVMFRTDNDQDEFVQATYRHPDGYLAPAGEPWDRSEIRREYRRRNKPSGPQELRQR